MGCELQALAEQREIDVSLVGLDDRVRFEGYRQQLGTTPYHDASIAATWERTGGGFER